MNLEFDQCQNESPGVVSLTSECLGDGMNAGLQTGSVSYIKVALDCLPIIPTIWEN